MRGFGLLNVRYSQRSASVLHLVFLNWQHCHFSEKFVTQVPGKLKFSKSGSESAQGIIRSHWKTKIGVMGPTSALTAIQIFVSFGGIFPYQKGKTREKVPSRDVSARPPLCFFKFRKKFHNPHDPNFQMCFKEI